MNLVELICIRLVLVVNSSIFISTRMWKCCKIINSVPAQTFADADVILDVKMDVKLRESNVGW